MFLPFKEFPWFSDASIRQSTTVERPSPHDLYWPDLDIDLAVESIEQPDKYPLASRHAAPPRISKSPRAPCRFLPFPSSLPSFPVPSKNSGGHPARPSRCRGHSAV
ncbi:MAG: DUF2442 domain-containing protein [Candidatus Zixiibacteriota bacterium]